jgi:hypothetical protein
MGEGNPPQLGCLRHTYIAADEGVADLSSHEESAVRRVEMSLTIRPCDISSLRMRSQRSTRPGARYRKRVNGAAARAARHRKPPAQTGLGLRRISTGRQQASSANYSNRPIPLKNS